MKYFSFVDQTQNQSVLMGLQDLARALAKDPTLDLGFAVHALYDVSRHHVSVSSFWDHVDTQNARLGQKSDVYLRAFGSAWFSDIGEIQSYLNTPSPFQSLRNQLLCITEDYRLERICRKLRPGTRHAFEVRRQTYRAHFGPRLIHHLEQGQMADAFVLCTYLCLDEHGVNLDFHLDLPEEIRHAVGIALRRLLDIHDVSLTRDVTKLCSDVVEVFEPYLHRDSVSEYFWTTATNGTATAFSDDVSFEDLVRRNEIELTDELPFAHPEDIQQHEITSSVWHEETGESIDNLIQRNLEHGTNTNLLSDKWRESHDEVDSMSVVQGRSQSDVKQGNHEHDTPTARTSTASTLAAVAGHTKSSSPSVVVLGQPVISSEVEVEYRHMVEAIQPYRTRLKRRLQEQIEQKHMLHRADLLFGRLSKNLVRVAVEPSLRLFYKKQSPTTDLDAVFLLLVDCSGSMYDRLHQTKLGVTLFHEVLLALRVPHAVVGFWEDAKPDVLAHPVTVLQKLIDFHECLDKRSGLAIAEIHAQLDNRDGEAIRWAANALRMRQERRKFLLVFSDGEPAASDYDIRGVLDTHQAVTQARRMGIDVINIFFTEGEADAVNAIHEIYGRWALTMDDVNQLTERFSALLQKLLFSAV